MDNAQMRKVGLFGGSFDPVHNGHVTAARAAMAFAGLDEVILIPAAVSPLKLGHMRATGEERLEMLRLALAGERRFRVSDAELDKAGLSYTIDTVRYFLECLPNARLFFIMGADSLESLARWKEAERLVTLCDFITLARSGWTPGRWQGLDSATWERLRAGVVQDFCYDISSTAIRHRIARGESVSGWVDPAVEQYIAQHGLYRD